MTSLTVNGSSSAASTLAAAGKLFSATGGASGNVSTKVGSSTLFKQIFAKGTATNQTGVSSIPAPTDSNFNGWMWDVTTLVGQYLQAGTWTPTFSLLASTSTTVTPTVQWYKRSSAGVYTQIGSVAGSSIALTTSSQSLTFTPPSLSAMSFTTGDKLVCWLWVNQTAGGATNSTISVVEDTGGTAGVASAAQSATPGYVAQPALSGTCSGVGTLAATLSPVSDYAGVVLADSPLRYYRLDETSGTTARDCGSQAQDGTLNGGITLSQTGLLVSDADTAELLDGVNGSYISVPTTGLPTGSQSVSLEAWIKPAVVPSKYTTIVAIGTFSTNETIALQNNASGQLEMAVQGVVEVIYSSAMVAGRVYHCVGTYDGNALTLYVNGSNVASSNIGATNVTYGVVNIGTDANFSAAAYFDGVVDEVAIYSTALSTARIMTHYLAGANTCTLAGVGTLTISAPSLSTALTGTLAGTGTQTATFSLATALTGTLAGTGQCSPTLTASLALPSTTLAGVGTLTVSGPSLSTTLSAECNGVGTLTPVLSANLDLGGATLAGIGTATGTLSCTTALSGEADGVGTLTMGSPALTTALSAEIDGVGILSGTCSLTTALSVACDGVGQLSGTCSLTTALTSEMDGVGTLTGALSIGGNVVLAGECDGVGTLTGTVSANTALSVTMTGTGVLSETVSLTTSLSDTLSGTGTLTGMLAANIAVIGTLSGSGTISGTLTLSTTLSVTCMATGTLTVSNPSLTTSLSAESDGVGVLDASLSAAMTLSGVTLAGTGTLSGAMSLSIPLVCSLASQGVISVTWSYATALFLVCAASGVLTGRLTVPNALVFVRSGAGEFRVRGGQATVLVRSGEAELLVRSGQGTILVEED